MSDVSIESIKKENNSSATPTNSMITTISLLFFYYIARYIFCDRYSVKKYGKNLSFVFGFIVAGLIIFKQFNTNLAATGDHCSGDVQATHAITYTLVPNLIFGLTVFILLNKYPSWKSPFSNTIGYMIASVFGLRGTFNSMLRTSSNEGTDTINKIYKDPSMLINELQPDAPTVVRHDSSFDIELKRLAKANIFKEGWEKKAKTLYNLVVIKDMVASLVWYILTYALIIATSFNGIMNISCIRSEKTLAKGKEIGNFAAKMGSAAASEAKKVKKKTEGFLGGKPSSSLSGSAGIY